MTEIICSVFIVLAVVFGAMWSVEWTNKRDLRRRWKEETQDDD